MPVHSSLRTSSHARGTAPAFGIRHVQCLRWDVSTQCWWWADSAAGTLRSWSQDGQQDARWALPSDAGAFAQCGSGRLLLCHPKRIYLATAPATPQAGGQRGWRLHPLIAVDPAEPRTSIHEGRTDRNGCFVFGTRNDGADARPIGSFYQFSRQRGLRRLALPAVTLATSICFSVDGRRLYFADGALSRIMQCDYDADSASIANVREFTDTGALPEASVVDRDGNLWNAQAGAERLVQYAQDGSVLQRMALPWGAPASLAFGGRELDQLVIGSADGLIRLPDAGAVGLPDGLFDDH